MSIELFASMLEKELTETEHCDSLGNIYGDW